MNNKSIEDKALTDLKELASNCSSLDIATLCLALASHDAVWEISTIAVNDESYNLADIGSIPPIEIEPYQEFIFASITINGEDDYGALLFDGIDLVAIVRQDSETQEVEEDMCTMTRANFFKFLDTLPNVFKFANPENPMSSASPEGLYLLQKLAAHGSWEAVKREEGDIYQYKPQSVKH